MPCFRPIDAWRSAKRGRSGKQLITFNRLEAVGFGLQLPCGQCVGCRLERSRQWAMRCVHEASLYESNCFITLTYDNEFLPKDGSLNKKHFQDFMKRLRRRFSDSVIRYYHCGEYGSQRRRPHYHACLFNFDFLDKKLFKIISGHRLYTSDDLSLCWKFGFCSVGSLTFESAAYVARYIMKKVTGDRAKDHYLGVDEDTGEVTKLLPEYTTMSRRPGIGRDWYDRFSTDVFPDDFVIMRGKRMRPPRFYDSIFEVDDPDEYSRIKRTRVRESRKHIEDQTVNRLIVRERSKELEVSRLLRGRVDDEA